MSDWKNAGYSPRESGAYPPGAEFDPRAPWNDQEIPEVECADCEGYRVLSGCCEDYPVKRIGLGYRHLLMTSYKCSYCGRFTKPVECHHCEGDGYREATADEMDRIREDELGMMEEARERAADEARGR